MFIIKELSKGTSSGRVSEILNEIRIQNVTNGNNQFVAIKSLYQDEKSFYLILEHYEGGSLFNFIE